MISVRDFQAFLLMDCVDGKLGRQLATSADIKFKLKRQVQKATKGIKTQFHLCSGSLEKHVKT